MRTDLDFSRPYALYSIWVRGLLLAGLALIAWVWWCGARLDVQIKQASARMISQQIQPKSTSIDNAVDTQIAAAIRTQQSLNTPWLSMTAELEQVKSRHPNVRLLSVTPNPAKAEIVLVGEAKQFADITHFFDDLKKHPKFGDAILQRQHLIDPESVRPVYSFNATVLWADLQKRIAAARGAD